MFSALSRKNYCWGRKAISTKLPWSLTYSLHPSLVVLLKRENSHQSPFIPPPQSSKKITKLTRKDKIPDGFELVYQSPIAKYLGLAQLTSLAVGTALVALAVTFPDAGIQPSDDFVFGPQNSFEGKSAYGGVFMSAVCFQYISLKSPLRMYTDGETFILVLGHLLLGPYGPCRKYQFTAGSAKLDAPFRLSPWNSVRYDINGKKYFIYENSFRTNADYLSMLGSK